MAPPLQVYAAEAAQAETIRQPGPSLDMVCHILRQCLRSLDSTDGSPNLWCALLVYLSTLHHKLLPC